MNDLDAVLSIAELACFLPHRIEFASRIWPEINAGLADFNLKARLAELGNVPFPLSPAGIGKLIDERDREVGKVVKFAAMKAE